MSDLLTWFLESLDSLFSSIWSSILDSVVSLIESISLPDFLLNQTYFIPTSIMYFASAFNIHSGFVIIISAYTFRFFFRRLPFIN